MDFYKRAVTSGWRANILGALGDLGDKRAVETMLEAVSDPDQLVWGSGALSLGKLRDSRGFEPLIQMLRDDGTQRRSAAIGLGHLNDKRAVPHLIAALSDTDVAVRYSVAEALGRLGDEAAIPVLQQLAQNDTGKTYNGGKVKDVASRAINRIRDTPVKGF